jgi:hypothetical protein
MVKGKSQGDEESSGVFLGGGGVDKMRVGAVVVQTYCKCSVQKAEFTVGLLSSAHSGHNTKVIHRLTLRGFFDAA